jgi:hypothetical protein
VNYKQVNLSTPQLWKEELIGLPYNYFHSWEYCNAISETTKIDSFLVSITNEHGKFICTLNKRAKINGYDEIFTPYGYGGIVIKCTPGKENYFIDYWLNFASKNKYINAYLMQHPLTNLGNGWENDTYSNHQVYLIDLEQTTEILWRKLRKGHKYEINKAINNTDIEIITDKNILFDPFTKLYSHTLQRVNASDTYKFHIDTLKKLAYSKDATLVGIKHQGTIKAATLFLDTNEIGEYFISAASDDGRNFTRALIWKTMLLLKQKGVKKLNLGGGVRPDDDLAAFKRRFGAEIVPLKVVKNVFDQSKYDFLCKQFNCSNKIDQSYFPPYWKSKK